MRWSFRPIDDGRAWAMPLEEAERSVLIDVVDDVVAMLGGQTSSGAPADRGATGHPLDAVRMDTEPVAAPVDPAVLRLLPDASRDDPAVSAEFRRLTEADVRHTKVTQLTALRAALASARPDLVVRPDQAAAVAAAMTDVRLVLGERLGVRTDSDAELLHTLATRRHGADEDTEVQAVRRFLATVYVLLSVLQDSLVELMLEALPDVGHDDPGPTGAPDDADGPLPPG